MLVVCEAEEPVVLCALLRLVSLLQEVLGSYRLQDEKLLALVVTRGSHTHYLRVESLDQLLLGWLGGLLVQVRIQQTILFDSRLRD